ncbi:hypothetical protein, partial [Arhodomonas sp. KWT]
DAWLAALPYAGAVADMTLAASSVTGTLDVADVRSLTVDGAVDTGAFAAAVGDLGMTVNSGAGVTAAGAIDITGDHLAMQGDAGLTGDRLSVDVAGDIVADRVRARGGAADTDLLLDAGGSLTMTDDGSLISNDAGLARLRAGGHIGTSARPLEVDVDTLHADALGGDLRLHSDHAIGFVDRSTASGSGTATARIVAPAVTGADLIADRLLVEAGTFSGPRLETRDAPMDLAVDGLADIGTLIAGTTAVIDAGALAIDSAAVTDTLTATTTVRSGADGHQDLGTLDAGARMSLTAAGDVDYDSLTGDATLAMDVAGTATGRTATFEDTLTFTGTGDYDVGAVTSNTGDVIADDVGGAFDVATLRTPAGLIDVTAGSSAIADGEAGGVHAGDGWSVSVVTDGAQDHGRLAAEGDMAFEAGIDHSGYENDAAGGADFRALDLLSRGGSIHVDAGFAAVEAADAFAPDQAIRIHTTGAQRHGRIEGSGTARRLRADGRVELYAGDDITIREVIAGIDGENWSETEGGDADIESAHGDIVGNHIKASRDIILMAINGRLELNRLDYGRGYTLEAGRDIIAGIGGNFDSADGEIKAGRHIEITTLGRAGENGDILLGGLEATDGHIWLDAAGDILV